MAPKQRKNLYTITLFFLIVNLPYLTITCSMGTEFFFETFEQPDNYKYIHCTPKLTNQHSHTYLLIQKPTAEHYHLQEGDHVCYITDTGFLATKQISCININTPTPKYYLHTTTENQELETIYHHQILGKVITTIDENIWTTISLDLWEASRQNLNAVALLLN